MLILAGRINCRAKSPSSSWGINSAPSLVNKNTPAIIEAIPIPRTIFFALKAVSNVGRNAFSARFIKNGFLSLVFPLKKVAAKAKKRKVTTPAKAKAKKPVVKKLPAITTAFSKSQMLTHLAEVNDLTRKQMGGILESIGDLIERHIKKRACGEFVLPGMLKITTVKKKATKARKGINPFTGEETMFKAKPASRKVKIRPLKKLKDAASGSK